VPAAAGNQDVLDTIEQSAKVASGLADVRLSWREIFLDNPLEILVDFPGSYVPSIIYGTL
jgi:hypothetical protein